MNTAENSENIRLVTLQQAAKLTGLSSNTLGRFAEAGYFTGTHNTNHEIVYPLAELCKLLNIDQSKIAESTETFPLSDINNQQTNVDSGSKFWTSADFAGGSIVTPTKKTTPNKVIDLPTKHAPLTVNQIEQTLSDKIQTQPTETPTVDSTTEQKTTEDYKRLQNIIRGQEHEILKLQKVIELQEQLLETRESEIRDHKKQRRWLQERLEKQDLKSERDQLLLISEMQMLTKMYAQQHGRKPLLIQALEWLGFKNPEPQNLPNKIEFRDIKKDL